jgi:tetratricopeptide (TPR) repeat protein
VPNKKLLLKITVCLFLAGSTLAVYWPVGRHEFLGLDDSDYVADNLKVRAGLTWSSVRWAFSEFSASNWHPLTWMSHMLDCEVFGMDPGRHHLTSVTLHIANTLLLLLLLTRLTKAFWRSTIVAALFALHPLHVESVAWVSERKDVLSAFFFMLTLLAYAKYVEVQSQKAQLGTQGSLQPSITNHPTSNIHHPTSGIRHPASGIQYPAFVFYLLALVLFALGLMSKPMLVTVPFVLLLLDYWPLHRFGSSTLNSQFSTLRRLLLEKLPFFVLSAASCVLTVWAQQKGSSVAGLNMIPFFTRCINSLISYFSYLQKMLWPINLAVYYPYSHELNYGLAWLSALILLGISVWAIGSRQSRPFLLIGWLWYLGMLVPVIGLVQVGHQSMADRYTYLPSIGFFIMVVWLVADWARSLEPSPFLNAVLRRRFVPPGSDSLPAKGRGPSASRAPVRAPRHAPAEQRALPLAAVLAALSLAVLAACAVLTSIQLKTWLNTRTLFEHALKVTGQNFMAYATLGDFLEDEGKNQEALEYFRAASQLMPSYPNAWFGLGTALFELGNRSEALKCARQGLELKPNDPQGVYLYAVALLRERQWAEAERYLRRAIELRENYPEAHLHLGVALQQQNRWDEAVGHFQTALKFKPEGAKMRLRYAEALYQRQDVSEAITQYRAALKLQPKMSRAQLGLAEALVRSREFDEAAGLFSAVLAVNPDNARALDGLGYYLAMRNRLDEAFPYLVKASAVSPTNGFIQLHLAMALGNKGEIAQAIAHYRLAVKLQPDLALAMNNLAWLLATHPNADMRNGVEAVEMGERAVSATKEREPFYLGTLAAAYAEAGRFDDAVRTAQKTSALAQSLGLKELAERNERLLQEYKAGKPHRERVQAEPAR